MYCENCGAERNENQRFCTQCGMSASQQEEKTAAVKKNYLKNGLFTQILLVIIAVVLVFIAAFLVVDRLHNDSDKGEQSLEKEHIALTKRFMDAVLAYDLNAVLPCFHESIREDLLGGEMFSNLLSRPYDAEISYSITGVIENDDYLRGKLEQGYLERNWPSIEDAAFTRIVLTVKRSGVKTETIYYIPLVKLEGKWYIGASPIS